MTENSLVIKNVEDLTGMAKIMMESNLFSDTSGMAQASVKILAGRELGFDPFTSMSGINIIKGKTALGGNLVATLVKRHPLYNYTIDKSTKDECLLSFYEKMDGAFQKLGEFSFSMDDAKLAGLDSKDVWKKYPRNMLFYRALTTGVRLYCPDVTGGVVVYTAEELDVDSNEFGEVSGEYKQDLVEKNKQEDEKKILKEKQEEIVAICKTLNSKNDPDFVGILEKYNATNPNKIKDISVLQKLKDELTPLLEREIIDGEIVENVENEEVIEENTEEK